MSRINLGNGQWFDSRAARKWNEDTYWDGNNHVSRATGSQWDHEKLYRTAKGRWILRSWSQWQGSRETYEIIGEADAKAWLVNQGHDVDAVFPGTLEASEV